MGYETQRKMLFKLTLDFFQKKFIIFIVMMILILSYLILS